MIGHRFAISYLLRWFRTLPWNVFICFLIELSSTFLAMQCNAKQTLHRLVILRFFPITSPSFLLPSPFLVFASSIGKASKKPGYFTVRLTVSDYPTPPLKVSFLWIFWCVFILEYDSMCSEMDFTPEKSFSSNYKISQLLFTAATAALSQNSQIAILQRR